MRVRDAHLGDPPPHAAPSRLVVERRVPAPRRTPSPVAPERIAVLQALLADLLERCGTAPRGEVPAAELRERYRLTHEQLQEQINLLNLVNFGGGCYAVYAEIQEDDVVRVDKELYGEEFRRPARLSPLEAKAHPDGARPRRPAGRRDGGHDARRGARARSRRRSAATRCATRRSRVAQPGEEDILTTLNQAIYEGRLVKLAYLSRTDDDGAGARDRAVPAARRAAPTGTSRRTTARRRRAHVPRRPHPQRAELLRRDVRAARGPAEPVGGPRAAGRGRLGAAPGARPTSPPASSRSRRPRRELADGSALATITYSSER